MVPVTLEVENGCSMANSRREETDHDFMVSWVGFVGER